MVKRGSDKVGGGCVLAEPAEAASSRFARKKVSAFFCLYLLCAFNTAEPGQGAGRIQFISLPILTAQLLRAVREGVPEDKRALFWWAASGARDKAEQAVIPYYQTPRKCG